MSAAHPAVLEQLASRGINLVAPYPLCKTCGDRLADHDDAGCHGAGGRCACRTYIPREPTTEPYDEDEMHLSDDDDGGDDRGWPATVAPSPSSSWQNRWYPGQKRPCDYCGGDYPAERSTSRYCGQACRKRANRAAHGSGVRAVTTTFTRPDGSRVTLTAEERVAGLERIAAVARAKLIEQRDGLRNRAANDRDNAAHHRAMAARADRSAAELDASADKVDAEINAGQQQIPGMPRAKK